MPFVQNIMFFAVSFIASIIGSICGIGGGVIIKPAIDAFGWLSVSTISFLSGCAVLSMSGYTMIKAIASHNSRPDTHIGTPLALGAIIGGVCGRSLFSVIEEMFEYPNRVGAVQAICLMVLTIGAIVYVVNKRYISTKHVSNRIICLLIGMALGVCSSFLGIGGGPINIVVLLYFFSMDSKTAAINSLYIILFSQMASLVTSIVTNSVPTFSTVTLILMVFGGITGGMIGREINKRIREDVVVRLFVGVMIVIVCICMHNTLIYINT